jgi:hypothetical protein
LKSEVGNLAYGDSKRFLLYHMQPSLSAVPGTYVFRTRLTYTSGEISYTKDMDFSVSVIGNDAQLNIVSVKSFPVLPIEGEVVELNLRVENSGDGRAKSIKVFAEHPFQGVKQNFIGTLKSDENGPAIFTFIPDKAGEYEFPIIISYVDDFGEKEIKTNINLTILEKKTNWQGIIIGMLGFILVIWGVFYFLKIKKTKDKIIHQLLKNSSKNNDK